MIQIDMPIPTNCLDCPACNEYLMCAIPVNGRGWGENDVREYGQSRPEWCPMKEQDERYASMVASWLREIAINNVDSNREMTFLDAVEDIRDRASYGLKQYFIDKQEGR